MIFNRAALGIIVTSFVVALLVVTFMPPVEAAQPAPPEVVPCQVVNTATFNSGVMIEVALCKPEGALPFLLNSYGFMKDAE